MEAIFLEFCYIVGMISFTVTGCWTCIKLKKIRIAPICTVLSAFGGGMIFRDIILLNTVPGALIEPQELLMALCFAFWFIHVSSKLERVLLIIMDKRLTRGILDITDALGSGAFISIGYFKANTYGLSPLFCILSGIVTTFGGGILAALVRGSNIKTILHSAFGYRVIIIINAVGLHYLHTIGVPTSTARCIIILSTTIPCIVRTLIIDSDLRINLYNKYRLAYETDRTCKESGIRYLYFYIAYKAKTYRLVNKKTLNKMYFQRKGIWRRKEITKHYFMYRPISFSAG